MTTTMTLEAGFMVTRMVLGQWPRDNGTVRGFFLFSHPYGASERVEIYSKASLDINFTRGAKVW